MKVTLQDLSSVLDKTPQALGQRLNRLNDEEKALYSYIERGKRYITDKGITFFEEEYGADLSVFKESKSESFKKGSESLEKDTESSVEDDYKAFYEQIIKSKDEHIESLKESLEKSLLLLDQQQQLNLAQQTLLTQEVDSDKEQKNNLKEDEFLKSLEEQIKNSGFFKRRKLRKVLESYKKDFSN